MNADLWPGGLVGIFLDLINSGLSGQMDVKAQEWTDAPLWAQVAALWSVRNIYQ
jgi:hypothetical protein